MTVEVDDACAASIACEFQNFGVGADFHDDAVADGEGLGHRVLAIYSENVAVKQEQVGTWVLREETCGQQQGDYQRACQTELAVQRHRWTLLPVWVQPLYILRVRPAVLIARCRLKPNVSGGRQTSSGAVVGRTRAITPRWSADLPLPDYGGNAEVNHSPVRKPFA